MTKPNGDWEDIEEAVALSLINTSGMNSLAPYHFDTVEDVPYPRLRSEIPYATAAIAAIEAANRLIPELPEGWWVASIAGTPNDYQCIIAFGHPLQMGGPPKQVGLGSTISEAIRNAMKEIPE